MTTRSRALIHAALIVLLVTVFSAPGRSQEQAGQPAPQPQQEKTMAGEPAQQKPGELIVPEQEKPAPAEAKAVPAKEETGTYTIKQADTLWDISNTFLKDPFLWPLIWKANPYIINPDLIYPGNALVIPSLAPIERAMKAPAEAAPEKAAKEEAVEETPRQGIAAATSFLRKKEEPEKAVEEETAAGPRIILPEEAAAAIIDKYSLLRAGYVNEEESGDMIVGGLEPKANFSFDDVVFIKLRSRENVNVGDRFLIYDLVKKVKHPETGVNFGKLIKVNGILQITAIDTSSVLTGKITLSFDASLKGSRIAPYQEPTFTYESAQAKTEDIKGYVLEVMDGRTINAQTDFVYLDKGSFDKVETGDRFNVFIEPRKKGYPKKLVGEVQVILVKERTSTAIVRKSTDTLAKGDVVELKK